MPLMLMGLLGFISADGLLALTDFLIPDIQGYTISALPA